MSTVTWTEDRVARLAKLWAEGLSAARIAEDLGGVTRNAVIGKVHRLGLSGRAKSTTKADTGQAAGSAPRRKSSTRASTTSAGQASSAQSRTTVRSTATHTHGNAALKMEMEEEVVVEEKVNEDNVVPISRKLTLLQLTENTCKWPTGDPTMPGFSFCGQSSADEKPYCEFHNKLAFQPPSERRRRR